MFEEPAPPPPLDQVEPTQPYRPSVPVGWLVSGALLFLLMVISVANYFAPKKGEQSFGELQDQLRYHVSLKETRIPSLKEVVDKSAGDGLRTVLKEATSKATTSDEAARIAVVASRELDKDPPAAAMSRLAGSKDKASKLIFLINAEEKPELADVDALRKIDSKEFAVKLAVAQAQKALGQKDARGSITDESLLVKLSLAALGFVGALVAGVVCLIVFLDARKKGRLAPAGFSTVTRWDGDRFAARFAAYLIIYVLVSTIVEFQVPKDAPAMWVGAATLVTVLALSLLFLKVPIQRRADSFRSVLGRIKPLGRNIGLAVFAYLSIVPILLVAVVLAQAFTQFFPQPTHPIVDEIRSATSTDWLALFLTAAVLAPVLEELTFRGMLLPALASRTSRPLWAMLACGFLFACIHPQGPLIWPALMSVGVAAAYLRYYTGSVVPSIVLHMIHNGLLLSVSYFLI